MLLGSFPTMKASLIVALLAVAVVAAAAVTIPMQKRPRLPLSAEHAEMLSRDGYVPLKGNIPNYGEYVSSDLLFGALLLVSHASVSVRVPRFAAEARKPGKKVLPRFSPLSPAKEISCSPKTDPQTHFQVLYRVHRRYSPSALRCSSRYWFL